MKAVLLLYFRILVAALLSAMCAINWLGIAAVLEEAKSYYNVSTATMNTVSSMYLAVYCVTCLPCAYLTDRMGVHRALVLGGLSQALGAAVAILRRRNYFFLFIGSIMAAIGQPLLVQTAPAVSQRYAPESIRTRCTTIISVANNLGSAVAYSLAPFITSSYGLSGWLVLRFLLASGIFVLALLAFCFHDTSVRYLRADADDCTDLPSNRTEEEEAEHNKSPAVNEEAHDDQSTTESSWLAYLKRTLFMLKSQPKLGILICGYALGQGAFWSWAELIDDALGQTKSDASIGDIGAIVTVIACFAAILFGAAVDFGTFSLDHALAAAQCCAALACCALALACRKPWTLLAPAWLAFSLSSTPVMPLGSELAARFATQSATPDLVAAAVSLLFLAAEVTSALFALILGDFFTSYSLLAVIALLTISAATTDLLLLLTTVYSPSTTDETSRSITSLEEPLLLPPSSSSSPR